MQEILQVYSYAKEFKSDMYKAIAFLSASVILSVLPYFLLYQLIASLFGAGGMGLTELTILSFLVFLSLVGKNYLHGQGLSVSHRLAYDTLMGMRQKAAEKLLRLPLGTVQKQGTGSLKKHFVENIEDMEIILAHAMPEGISNLLTIGLVSIILLVLDWRLALVALAVVPLGAIPVALMIRDSQKFIDPYYKASQAMNENIIEYIAGMEVVKVFNQTTSSFAKYRQSVEGFKEHTLDWYRVSWTYMTLYSVLLPSTLLFLLPFGTWLYLEGSLQAETFVLCILLALSLGIPTARVVEFLPIFPMLRNQARKLEDFFAEPELPNPLSGRRPLAHNVVFDNVTFAYEQVKVLDGVSLTAPANAVTAIVGESGAGKSTLAKLLVRFWDIQGGSIKIGNLDIRDLSFDTLMKEISYVSQDIFLFNTSIRENIRMGRPEASDEEVENMARLAQCHEFIQEMEQGYDTVVGEAGDKLSGGQRQRISIARAMLKNAPIIVLDEATAFTDPENEDKIQAALSSLIQGKTLIVIAHRLSTICHANQIIVMEQGKVAARGTHQELLAHSPLYRRMWEAHQESMNWGIGA